MRRNWRYGANYRAQGSAARGRKYWNDTAPQRRETAMRDFALAEPPLRQSITLTAKPYLSLLITMRITGAVQNRPFLDAELLLANEALPGNVRGRLIYARFLLPRWGGSYEKFDTFLALSRDQGVADSTMMKLRAIALNDRGLVLHADHDGASAYALYNEALLLARQSGDEGDFRAVFLEAAVRQVCKEAVDVPGLCAHSARRRQRTHDSLFRATGLRGAARRRHRASGRHSHARPLPGRAHGIRLAGATLPRVPGGLRIPCCRDPAARTTCSP